MSNFTPLVEQEFEFEGDVVKVSFARLKRKDMLAAMPALKKLNEAEDEKEKSEAMNDVLNGIVDVVPDYIKSFTGLNDSQGTAIEIDSVCSEYYFVKLAAQISVAMLNASSAQEGKV